ncbi:alkyl/aryl-sulfatase [Sphingosinicella soli]|uniref:Alkyl sulfatase BDS1-like metallo-beta-lactamase superfamily hydrolase n=1 Tax=Sphingosinicella soli TaxID=333708 RepID=A0A7W7B5G6_9SPHN|nr:alkyl sulfatase dimerization domain-containing protein [Sphingosinicella soli]MBB4633450.1 alkyl sulfatase BDS1-like metallo-beta-lactamase superfamily hydrolase [Sphingosinicella soli]
MMRLWILAALAAAHPAAAEVPSAATKAANSAAAAALPFGDTEDFDFARRGLLARPDSDVLGADGRVIRSFADDAKVAGPAPDTVNPSLWRNAQLVSGAGLFEVVPGLWQVRGYDLANMTLIRGRTGLIVVDPLTTVETARAAMALARRHIGDLPVTAVIYTHSHIDHFGGVRGVVDEADVKAGKVRIYAPEGFMDHAISENVIAGAAMSRRAAFMFGTALEHGPEGIVSAGIGPVVAGGTYSLIEPTDTVRAGAETTQVDGMTFEFQLTPGTEAPAEMNVYLPHLRALCLAENANGAMHNVLTPRGALVRDAKVWADYLTEALTRFGGKSDVVFTSHFWPRWGGETLRRFMALHRDAYKYLHDQSVRMMNAGLNGNEIAEAIQLPPELAQAWFNRPNYGSLKFNARAVYQRYMGHYDGNPAHLDPLPDVERGKHIVAAIGGAQKVLAEAAKARKSGDERWAAELLSHLVMAEPDNARAKEMLAAGFEQMAWATETAPWRNIYLSGARELRGLPAGGGAANTSEIAMSTPLADLLDLMAVRLSPEKAAGADLSIGITLPDSGERRLVSVRNRVLVHQAWREGAAPAVTLTSPRRVFLGLVGGQVKAAEAVQKGILRIDGDAAQLQRFTGLFETPPATFGLALP